MPVALAKGGFFQKVRFVFLNLQKTILSLKFKFPTINTLLLLAGNIDFKFMMVFWNIFFLKIWRFEKQITLSERETPLELSYKEDLTHFSRSLINKQIKAS